MPVKHRDSGNRQKGINDDIAVKTARFIVDTAIKYDADCIVMEYLDLAGKKRGSKKQRLHLWRAKYVQTMVTDKAHRNMIRVARVCAWNTSRLAFDGSGRVMRGKRSRSSKLQSLPVPDREAVQLRPEREPIISAPGIISGNS